MHVAPQPNVMYFDAMQIRRLSHMETSLLILLHHIQNAGTCAFIESMHIEFRMFQNLKFDWKIPEAVIKTSLHLQSLENIEILKTAIYSFELLSSSLFSRNFPERNQCFFRTPPDFFNLRKERVGAIGDYVLGQHFFSFQTLIILIFPSGSWKLRSI